MTTEKKHKSGFVLLKEKLAKAEAVIAGKDAQIAELESKYKHDIAVAEDEIAKLNKLAHEWECRAKNMPNVDPQLEKQCAEAQKTIEQQGRKISQLTADLRVANGNLAQTDAEHKRQMDVMYNSMLPLSRWLYDMKHAPATKAN